MWNPEQEAVSKSYMEHAAKLSLRNWLQLKGFTFGLAVFNFVLLWNLDVRMRGIGTLVDPWYHPWSYFNEPTQLLLASTLLLTGRIWSYLAAIGISGYIVIRFVYLLAVWDGSWFQERSYLGQYFGRYFFGSFESQVLFALIVLVVGLYYLARVVLRRRRDMVGG